MPTKSLEEIIQDMKVSHRTLYVLCGLPYSGKTYLSREIRAKIPCVYVSIDEIFRGSGYDWDSNRLPDEGGWKKIFNDSYRDSQDALKNNMNVLYDSTNHTRASRDELRRIAGDVGARTKVIYVDAPVEEIWKRWEKNRTMNERSVVDRKLVEMTVNSFEVPTEDESVLAFKAV
jgi:predicted kinase